MSQWTTICTNQKKTTIKETYNSRLPNNSRQPLISCKQHEAILVTTIQYIRLCQEIQEAQLLQSNCAMWYTQTFTGLTALLRPTGKKYISCQTQFPRYNPQILNESVCHPFISTCVINFSAKFALLHPLCINWEDLRWLRT